MYVASASGLSVATGWFFSSIHFWSLASCFTNSLDCLLVVRTSNIDIDSVANTLFYIHSYVVYEPVKIMVVEVVVVVMTTTDERCTGE